MFFLYSVMNLQISFMWVAVVSNLWYKFGYEKQYTFSSLFNYKGKHLNFPIQNPKFLIYIFWGI